MVVIIVLKWWGGLRPSHTLLGIGAFGAGPGALGPVSDLFWAKEQKRKCHMIQFENQFEVREPFLGRDSGPGIF